MLSGTYDSDTISNLELAAVVGREVDDLAAGLVSEDERALEDECTVPTMSVIVHLRHEKRVSTIASPPSGPGKCVLRRADSRSEPHRPVATSRTTALPASAFGMSRVSYERVWLSV